MTDALVEAVARAISLSGSCIAWEDHHFLTRGKHRNTATAALQAIEAAGYRVVPVEATEEMVSAGCGAIEDIDQENVDENDTRFWGQPWRPCAIGTWSAMLSAAPRVGEG